MNNNLTYTVVKPHMAQKHYNLTPKFNNTVLEYETPGEGSDNILCIFLHKYGHFYN